MAQVAAYYTNRVDIIWRIYEKGWYQRRHILGRQFITIAICNLYGTTYIDIKNDWIKAHLEKRRQVEPPSVHGWLTDLNKTAKTGHKWMMLGWDLRWEVWCNCIEKRTVVSSERVMWLDAERIKEVEKNGYKYLGILEYKKIKEREIKKLLETFLRTELIMKNKLKGRNNIMAMNTWTYEMDKKQTWWDRQRD